MATDKNWFDDWLKLRLLRDILFRIIVWTSIATLGAYFIAKKSSSAQYMLDRLKDSLESLGSVFNVIGVIGIIFSVIALMFKDMEIVGGPHWNQSHVLGRSGGVFRRLAGDLTLWMIGTCIAMISALTATILSVHHSSGISSSDVKPVFGLYFMLLFFLFITSFLNLFVRGSDSFLTSEGFFGKSLKNPKIVITIYSISLIYLVYTVAK